MGWSWQAGLTVRMPIPLSEGMSGHLSYHLHNCPSPQTPTYCLGVSQPHSTQREPLFSSLPPQSRNLPLWFGVVSVFSLSSWPLGAPNAAQCLQINIPVSLGRELKAQISISTEEASSSAPPSHCVRPGVGVWREVGKGIFRFAGRFVASLHSQCLLWVPALTRCPTGRFPQ